MVIAPDDINTTAHFWDAFGNTETEISANWIVRFCQTRGHGWEPFTYEEIERFYNEHGYHNFWFNGLLSDDQRYIHVEDGRYTVTLQFVARCYAASPAR